MAFAAAVFTLRDRLVEGWRLHRLDSSVEAEREAAAAGLAAMQSLRAVERLLRSIRSLRCGAWGRCMWEDLRFGTAPCLDRARLLVRIAERMPFAALPLLVEALRDPEPGLRAHAAQAIGGLGLRGQRAAIPLEAFSRDPNPAVRASATAALEKVRGG